MVLENKQYNKTNAKMSSLKINQTVITKTFIHVSIDCRVVNHNGF